MATGVAITSVIQAPTGLRPSGIQVTQQSKGYLFKSQLGRTFPSKKRSITCIQANPKPDIEVVRRLANFPPPIWGDRFLSFSLDDSELEAYAKDMEKPKEDIRRLIVSPSMDSNAKLRLINSVYRLGMKYLFEEEIESQLDKLFKDLRLEDYDEADLYTVSINFQVFRQHGYRLSCDVFNKFKDWGSGKFKEYITADVRGMLSFYESTQLRIKEESILDEAAAFTEAQLKGVVDSLNGNLARQVKHALQNPYHKGMHMVEARLYFSNYEEECSTYDSLRKLAIAHFNYLQLLHKNELQIYTKWSNDLELNTKFPFIRKREPEIYTWILGTYFEPHYAQGRIITSQIAQMVSLMNDIYDAYATIEEIRLITDAINRWESSAMEQLPEYAKPFFKVVLNFYAELENKLSKEGRTYMFDVSKQAFQDLARLYQRKAEWRHSGYQPSFQEYLKHGMISIAYEVHWRALVLGMPSVSNEEVFAWCENRPKYLEALYLLGRLQNDVVSFQFEGERGQSVSAVDAYMKTFGVPDSTVAIDEINKIIENAWKDINEGCLKPTEVSMELLRMIHACARMNDTTYRNNDGYTFPGKTYKEYITLLFIDPAPMY